MNFKELKEQIEKYPHAIEWNQGAVNTAFKDRNINEQERDYLLKLSSGEEIINQDEFNKRLEQLFKWGLVKDKKNLPLAKLLIKHWDDTKKMRGKVGENLKDLFLYGFPFVFGGIDNRGRNYRGIEFIKRNPEKYWKEITKDLCEMTIKAGKSSIFLFVHGLPVVFGGIDWNGRNHSGIEFIKKNPERYWKDIVQMAVKAGKPSWDLFLYGFPFVFGGCCWVGISHEGIEFIKKNPEKYWKEIIDMVVKDGKSSYYLFSYGVPFVFGGRDWAGVSHKGIEFIKRNPAKYWEFIKNELLWILEKVKEAEPQTFKNLPVETINLLQVEAFSLIIRPVVKSQTVASFLCFPKIDKLTELGALQTKEDAELLIKIINLKQRRAPDLLKNFLVPIKEKNILKTTLSAEKDCLLSFIQESPVMLPSLYEQFKLIYYGSSPNKLEDMKKLFKDAKNIISDIRKGTLSRNYDSNLFLGVLYSVFSPELSVDRDRYEYTLKKRDSRDSDIPGKIKKYREVKVRISKGSYIKTAEVDTKSWNIIVEAVQIVNQKNPNFDYAKIGLELLAGKIDNKLERHVQIYSFYKKTGESLPTFTADRETLLKYKEYVGDRLKNDAITQLLGLAKQTYPEEYSRLDSMSVNYKGLIKQVMTLWNKDVKDKEQIVIKIFSRNGIPVESLSWPTPVDESIINHTIHETTSKGIKKETVEKVFGKLCGQEYSQMQKEMSKFKFKSEGKSLFGDPFEFVLSKNKLHSVAMFNMGICVAPDDKLWNSQDMWQLIIFDLEGYAHGGCIMRVIEDGGKKYLVLSIQPASSILSSYSAEHIYSKIIQYSRILVKKLNFEGLLIPKSSSIHSNRSSIQSIINSKNYPEHTTQKSHYFSYDPHHDYQSFYLV